MGQTKILSCAPSRPRSTNRIATVAATIRIRRLSYSSEERNAIPSSRFNIRANKESRKRTQFRIGLLKTNTL